MRRSKNRGFTLIELIIVIAILGILAAAVTLSLTRYLEKARTSTCLSNLSQIQKKAELTAIDTEMSRSEDTKRIFETLKEELLSQGIEAFYSNASVNVLMLPELCPSKGYVILYLDPITGRLSTGCSIHKRDENALYYQSVSTYEYFGSLTKEEKSELKKKYGISYGKGNELLDNDSFRELFAAMNGYNSMPQVSQEITGKMVKPRTLYYQVYYTSDGILYYAADTKSISENKGQRWRPYLIYNPGDNAWYESISGNYNISDLSGKNKRSLADVYQDLQDPAKFKKLEE